MVCPNCNRINTGRNCYVHNVITCLYCLYDGVNDNGKHFCEEASFVNLAKRYKAEKDAEMDELLNRIPKGNTWVPQ